MCKETNLELLSFLEKSPSVFHAVSHIKKQLDNAGFKALQEFEKWNLEKGQNYYATRNDSSIIAFRLPQNDFTGFQITASHSDSPTFKIKEFSELDVDKKYTKLNVEGYGGMLHGPWFDRPLSVAGRIITKNKNVLSTHLVNIEEDLLMIPSLAIHMDRKANEGQKHNIQKDLLPLLGDGVSKDYFMTLIAGNAGVDETDIIGKDLFLYNRQKGTIWGAHKEFLASPRLDDLQCAFGSLKGFLAAEKPGNAAVYCVFDNEEVGSTTKQGAASTFLKDVLKRICASFDETVSSYQQLLAGSFMISADNAHAVHPNQPDKSDPANRVYINEGIVVKHSANQKYTTDAVSNGIFYSICQEAGVPLQHYVNRSDLPGGSTLGNISNTQASMNAIDIGLPQLAMHSPYETAGVKDTDYLIKAIQAFYETTILCQPNNSFELKTN